MRSTGPRAFLLVVLLLMGRLGRHVVAVTSAGPPRSDPFELCDLRNATALSCEANRTRESPHFNTDAVTTLIVRCNQKQPVFEADDLLRLKQLATIELTNCQLPSWPTNSLAGLRLLTKLVIRADDPEFHLEIKDNGFDAMPQVERIDLSWSNVWQMPQGVLCPLSNLVSLNISWNVVQDVAELGLNDPQKEEQRTTLATGAACSPNVRTVDVSNNRIGALPDSGFSILKQLSTLILSGNAISMVADGAFRSLRSLSILDLSNNKIVALPALVFREAAASLKELKLQNNSISALPPGLIANMNQLVALDLSRNVLTSAWLKSDTFQGLIRLVLLDLSFNRIEALDPDLFKDLNTLQLLNLRYNELETIPETAFAPLSNLHTLELSHNRLKYLDVFSLNGLFALSSLSLDYNLLEKFHADVFKNSSTIQDLFLSGNQLRSIPIALKDMRSLRTLDLGENQIRSIEEPAFEGLLNLYGLRLMGNELVNVTHEALRVLPTLQLLNLAKNKISYIEDGAFSSNQKLQAIRLDSNQLRQVPSALASAKSLVWLNVSDNLIEHFGYESLPDKLRLIDLHKNAITTLGVAPRSSKLHTLDLSFNKLSSVHAKSIPDSINLIFLNDNQITLVEPHTFFAKENLTRVDMYANQIVRMNISAFQISQIPIGRPLPEFYIGGNPFVCDCTTEWLQRINSLTLRQHPKVMDLDSVYCRLPYDRRHSFIPLMRAKPSQFLCSYTIHCFALCHCCDFDACDCEMTCPINCTCYHDESWSANVVDCSSSGYTTLPGRLPMDATEVYLDGNDFGQLTSHSFIGRKNLEILYANNSNIVAITNYTFSGLRKLQVLHLENNRITQLDGLEFAPLEALKELYLQNNLLSHIDNSTLLPLRHLEILRLDNNKLATYAVWQLAHNDFLVDVSLSSNPWSCECDYLERARDWMTNNKHRISDWMHIDCVLGIALVATANDSVNCAALTGITSTVMVRPLEAYLPLFLATGVLFFVLFALICGAFRHRSTLRTWALSSCGLRACYKTAAFEDREKPFDAYISYSAVDESFVSRVLLPNLETSYRLCLHYRDLSMGTSIADAVAQAADSSRRTILVLSKHFLHDEWARFEFRMALKEALKAKARSVILLLIGGVCIRDLDAELRKSSHTILVWGDKMFWQKLRFVMPDVTPSIPVLERSPPLPLPPLPPQHPCWA